MAKSNKNLIIEIGTEEIPYKEGINILENTKKNINEISKKKNIEYVKIKSFFTSRRIAFIINKIEIKNKIEIIKIKGPSIKSSFDENGNQTEAIKKFMIKHNVIMENLKEELTEKGNWFILEKKIYNNSKKIIKEFVTEIIESIKTKKSMKWGEIKKTFIRPVHWLIIMFNNKIVKLTFWNIKSNNFTYGNKYIHKKKIKILDDNYENILKKKGLVIVSINKRKKIIIQNIIKISKKLNLKPILNNELINELTGVVEYPFLKIGTFKKKFLKLPPEIIVNTIQKYNKCIPLKNKKIENKFIIINNVEINKKALIWYNYGIHSRLIDMSYAYNNDKKSFNRRNVKELKKIIFQKELGSMYDKLKRIKKLSNKLSKITKIKCNNIKKTISICKLDLLTKIVREIPELEGIIGSYYAKYNKLDKDIILALKELYKPRSSNDSVPKSDMGIIISISDKLDTLVGFFLINEYPTGNKDPFGLKRLTEGIIRTIIDNSINLKIKLIIKLSLKIYKNNNKTLLNKIYNFIIERFKFLIKKKYNNKLNIDLIKKNQNLTIYHNQIKEFDLFFNKDKSKYIIEIIKKLKNIFKKKKIKNFFIKISLIKNKEEVEIIKKYHLINILNKELIKKKMYQEILENIINIKNNIDDLFNKVIIIDKNKKIKKNRLSLIKMIIKLIPNFINTKNI